MSKSKKNTIDPEIMIKQYGADAVRWFILSDSPPEKDIQWSDTGVSAANKFLQKIWNLNITILNRNETKTDIGEEKEFSTNINNYIYKIDNAIRNFRYNVSIALFYEIYTYFKNCLKLNVSNKVIKDNMINIMTIMIPFTPHLSNECLEMLNSKNVNIWPKIYDNLNSKIKIAVQINGKTRDILNVQKGIAEKEISQIILEKSKANKYLKGNKIIKIIFIKDKIINYLTENK